jgi:dTDP-4-dehydrorhamnose 3,5-epimerase
MPTYKKAIQALIGTLDCVSPPLPTKSNSGSTNNSELIDLHYQIEPHARGCPVYVKNGQIFQVTVDFRKSSPTFSRWVTTVLVGDNDYRFRIPEGFACGMLTLSDFTDAVALTTRPYDENSMRCICRDDPAIDID